MIISWELTNRQTAYRKKILLALSHSPIEIFSKSVATSFGLGAVSTTQKALDVFIDDGIIEKHNKNYLFSDPFYKQFIINNI